MAKCGDCIQQYEKSKQRLRKAAAKKREAAQLEKPQPVQYQIRSADRFIPPGTNLTDLLNVLRLQTMTGAANPQTLTPSLERPPARERTSGSSIPLPRDETQTPVSSPAILGTPQFPFITEQRMFPVAQFGGRAVLGQALAGAAGLGGRALAGAAGLGGQALLGAAGLVGSGGRAAINFLGDAAEPERTAGSSILRMQDELPGRALATEAQPQLDPQPPPRFFVSPVVPPSVVDDLAARRAANPLPQPPPPLPLLPETETPLPERTVLDLMEREPDPGLVPAPDAIAAPVGEIQLLPEQPEEALPEELDDFHDPEEAPYEAQPKEEAQPDEDALPEDERPRQAQPRKAQPEEEQAENPLPLEVYERPTFTAASLAGGGGEVIPAETAASLTRPRTAAQLEGDLKKSEAAERKRVERGELIRKYGAEMRALGFIKNGDYDVKRYLKEREAANREGFLKNGEPDVEAYQNRQAEEFDELQAAGAAADVSPFL